VVVLDSVITHTNAWFLNREIHQLVLYLVIHGLNVMILGFSVSGSTEAVPTGDMGSNPT